MTLPALTAEQRAEATARATAARQARARIRTAIRESHMTMSEVIAAAAHDEAIAKLKVASLLEAVPGIGKTKAATIMERLDIAASRRIRGLGHHQIAALTQEFG